MTKRWSFTNPWKRCWSARLVLLLGLAGSGVVAQQDLVVQLRDKHQFRYAGYYAAKFKGYYEEEGLSVLLRARPSEIPEERVLEESADFGVGLSDLVLRYGRGDSVVAVATVFQHSPLVLIGQRTNGKLKVQDLEGGRVMLGDYAEELEAMLLYQGVDPHGLVRFPYKLPEESLQAGTVDAISGLITTTPYFLGQKGIPFEMTSARSSGIDFYGDTLFTNRRLAERSPEIVTRFRRATLKGWVYALENPEEMMDYILWAYPEGNTKKALQYEAVQVRDLIRPEMIEIGYMSQDRWQTIADAYHDLGLLGDSVALEGFLFDPVEPHPLMEVLWFVGPLVLLLLLSLLFAQNQRKIRKREREALEDLEQLERQMRTLLFNLPGMAYRCHNDGGEWEMEYVSPGAYALTGYRVEELQGKEGVTYGDLIHPEDVQMVVQEVEKANQENRRFKLEYRLRHKDGTYRWVWEQGVLVREVGDSDNMLEGFIANVDEQHQLADERESALKKLEETVTELEQLKGIIPVCSNCRKVRNDKGGWEQLEAYIRNHTDADFSHGICPQCIQEVYPGMFDHLLPDKPPGDEKPDTEEKED